MDKKLTLKLNQKSTLESLQNKYQVSMVVPCSQGSVFALLYEHDRSIGYIAGKKIHLNSGAWNSIRNTIRSEVGFDLLNDNITELSQKNRVENALILKNEKLAGMPPQSGFAMVRLLGLDKIVDAKTDGFIKTETKGNSYVGLHISDLEKWDISNLVVIENFAAFTAINNEYIKSIVGSNDSSLNILLYRGDKYQNIYAITDRVSKISKARYVFADYDLSGLSLAKVISDRISSDGYILPINPEYNEWFLNVSKKAERVKQSDTIITDEVLLRYFIDIKDRFLAVTQEALMAHDVPMEVVSTK